MKQVKQMRNGTLIEEIRVPAYEGRSALVRKGQTLYIIDVEGKQVGDFVCFNAMDPDEHVSPVHMRASLSSIRLKTGDGLYSNRRQPLMQLTQDTVGRHDFFFRRVIITAIRLISGWRSIRTAMITCSRHCRNMAWGTGSCPIRLTGS